MGEKDKGTMNLMPPTLLPMDLCYKCGGREMLIIPSLFNSPLITFSFSPHSLQKMEDAEVVTKVSHGGSCTGNNKKGGFRASGFIFALTSLESMGFVANMVSLVIYFMGIMCMSLVDSSNTLTNFMGSAFLLSLLGGFISDTYLSRLNTSLIFGALEVLALMMMTIQAESKNHLQPDQPCGIVGKPVSGSKEFYLYVTLSLLAIGVGGVKGALPALGADQFNQKDPTEAKALASFFNFLLLSTTAGATIGVTAIVWVNINKGWYYGFLISTLVTLIGYVILVAGKPFYRPQSLADSPILRITQVVYVAFKNRRLSHPDSPAKLFETTDKEQRIAPTDQFRFLDKAAILRKEANPEAWIVCSVTQVEEVKILTRMLPILGSTILLNTCMAQFQTFSVLQGSMMNPSLGSIKIPTPSIPVIPLLFMSLLLPLYEYVFVPFARKFTGHPAGITQLQRIGVGLVLCAISMGVAGIVEVKRRNSANNLGVKISLFWLSFQYGIFGIADMFSLIGLLEFFYREAPVGMRSLSTSFTWLSISFGYFLSSVLVNLINSITQRLAPSKNGWLYGMNLNNNNLDLFYWFLAILSIINFAVYLLVSSWYKYKTKEDGETKHQELDSEILEKKGVEDGASKPDLESKSSDGKPKDDEIQDASKAALIENEDEKLVE